MSWRPRGGGAQPRRGRAAARPGEITGRHVLIGMLIFFGVTIGVNVVFITAAARSFPGLVVDEPFRRGLAKDFNQTLEDRATQAVRGWRAGIAHDWNAETGDLRVEVVLVDAAGAPVTGRDVAGALQRVVTDAADRPVTFTEVERGVYVAVIADATPGEWRLLARTRFDDGAPFEAERRFIVR